MVFIDAGVYYWIVDYLINSLASINGFKNDVKLCNLNWIEFFWFKLWNKI